MPERKAMMKMRLVWTVMSLSALAAGCATATLEDLQAVQAGSEQARPLIESFAEAVRAKDPTLLPPLLSPLLTAEEVRERQARLRDASWLASYSGYSPDVSSALARSSWRQWRRTEVELEVPGTAALGGRFEDEFDLVRTEDEWRIYDFHMARPRRGDRLSPSEEVRRQVEAQARQIIADLQEGRSGSILAELSDKGNVFREGSLSLLERLLLRQPPLVPLSYDFEHFAKFMILSWPQPREPVDLRYDGPRSIAVHYDLPYVCPEAGIRDTDVLRMRLIFLETQAGWEFYSIRLSAKGIPYS